MINANGDRTRTRDGTDTASVSVLDSTHRLFRSECRVERERLINRVQLVLRNQSPATRRMLKALVMTLARGYSPATGYGFAQSANRAAIAAQLGRSVLVPYDIRVLRSLAAKGLVTESKRALPRKQFGDIWLGSGAEFVYSIPSDVLFALMAINPSEQARFKQLANRQATLEQAGISKAMLEKQREQLAQFETWRANRQPDKLSLLERISRWFDW